MKPSKKAAPKKASPATATASAFTPTKTLRDRAR